MKKNVWYLKNYLSVKVVLLLSIITVFAALPVLGQTINYFETAEEFSGPFPSWKNVKTDFGAKGDGTTDDYLSINNGLASLKAGSNGVGNVLYFPAGTYRITQPIKNVGRTGGGDDYSGMTVIGEDPATTVIKWDGATYTSNWKVDAAWATGPMAVFDGWNVKFSRLTFDGCNKARIGILRDGLFGTYCEFSDIYIKNVRIGIQLGGQSDQGQAEDAILRCRFTNCTDCGIWGPNMNTMDEYAWYCLFEDCGTGITVGGYHAVGCVFLRSKTLDLGMTWTPPCVIKNISIGSNKFAYITNAGSALFMGNQVFQCDSASPFEWDVPNFVLLDNIFDMGTTMRCVGNHLLSAGNTFTRQNPLTLEQTGQFIQFVNIDQKIVSPASLAIPTTIALPGAPKKSNRQIFEVRKNTGNDAGEIQTQIVAAVGVTPCGIVHIPSGQFSINRTIVVPANKDIQIVGDAASEYGSKLNWNGTGTGPILDLKGPSSVTIRDLMLNAVNNGADIVLVEKADQAGGRIYCEQVMTGGSGTINADKGFYLDGIENSDVIMVDGAVSNINPNGGSGVLAKGGPKRAVGDTTPQGQAYFFFGGLGNTVNLFNVANGGQLVALGGRDEVPFAGNTINLSNTSSGKLTVGAMSLAVGGSSTVPTIAVNGFNGTFTSVGNTIGQGYGGNAPIFFNVSGDGSKSNVLHIASTPEDWRDNSSPAAQAQFVPCGTGVPGALRNVINKTTTATVDTLFIRKSLAQLRNLRIEPLLVKPAGITDVKLIRVRAWAGSGKTSFTFRGDSSSAVLDRSQTEGSMNMGTFKKISVGMNSFNVPYSIKNIMVFDVMGKMVWSKRLTSTADRYSAEKSVLSLNRKNILFVQMEK